MPWKLKDYQIKRWLYKQINIYEPQSNHKPKTYNGYMKNRQESKCNTKGMHQTTKEETKRRQKELKSNQEIK